MKKITVTIGIPAYNEEINIELFLLSLFRQKLQKVDLKEILVYSDSSSDKTEEIVEKVSQKYPSIKLIKGKTRKGKYFRVNELFHLSKTDVLVILDADIALEKNNFIETLVTELESDKKALMMASHVRLVRPNEFIPKLIHTSFVLGDFIRLSVPGHSIASNFHGAATAYKKKFVKNLSIPQNLLDPHFYIYLSAKKSNGFRYCMDAAILQNPPVTIADVAKTMRRTIGKQDKELVRIFGTEMIQNSNVITRKAKVLGLLKCFLWQPFATPLAIIMTLYFTKLAASQKINTSPIWEINTSTKKQITYAN